jgi:dihydrofolate synthase/folylpolyglutamate synthase
MTYPEVIKYLDSFINYERLPQYPYRQSLKLERIREFLNKIDNPQENLKCIHIAGTKGKGSTSAFIAYILRQAGFKVGLYTSPHLLDFRERIRILNPRIENKQSGIEFEGMISCQELADLVERLRPNIEEFNSQSRYGSLSFFEVYTALALKYFTERKIDFAVLETGLGGRLDATNTVNSLIAGITPISYEHTRQLGESLTEIAFEKVGIIKNQKLIVITAPQNKEAIRVIRNRCEQQDAILYEIGKDVIFDKAEPSESLQHFNIDGVFGKLTDLRINLLGRHQMINAALAVSIVLALNKFYQAGLGVDAIKKGLYNTIWPGRFEIIARGPFIVLDGAQNVASAEALRETIIKNFPDKRIILILGISQDKDISGICRVLVPISDELILTQADNPRAADVDLIEQVIGSKKQEAGSKIFKIRSAKDAIELAREKADKDDLILVTGSLFLVGEARGSLLKNRDTLLIGSKGVPRLAERMSLKR